MWGQPLNPYLGNMQPMRVDVPQLPPMAAAVPQMRPQMSPMAAAVQAQPQKRGFFAKDGAWRDIAGIIADAIAGASGGQGMYAPMKMQQNKLKMEFERERQQAERENQRYERRRLDERDDFRWQHDYERANPKLGSAYRWETNDGSLAELGPDGQPRIVYKDPTPKPVTVYNPATGQYELQVLNGGSSAPPPRLKAPPPGAIPLPRGGAGSGPRGFPQ